MKNPIVLIEINGGFATAYASEGVCVSIHDRDTDGNDLGEKHRKANEKSFKALVKRLSPTDGVDPNEALEALESPAPTDWAEEVARLGEMRKKAIGYLTSVANSSSKVGFPHIYTDGYDYYSLELVGGVPKVCGSFKGRLESTFNEFKTPTLMEVAARVQKALAAGGQKP